MKKSIKKLSKKSKLGHNVIFQHSLNFYYVLRNILISDEQMIKKRFKKSFGYDLDLKNPKTFNEKIQWLKLNDRSDLHTICADKYKARQYIRDKIGSDYLVPLVFQTKHAYLINSVNIPDYPVIIKTNHDSANVFIVKDKSKVDWKKLQADLGREIRKNYYYSSQEWQYKNIEKRIIVEKLLIDKKNKPPIDCKVLCFNGKAKMISMDLDNGLPTHQKIFYDLNWNKVPIFVPSKGDKLENDLSKLRDIKKPIEMDSIIYLSEVLAKDFIHVRIDWHYIDGNFYNGEITFHSGNGLNLFNPKKWDNILGNYMYLPLK